MKLRERQVAGLTLPPNKAEVFFFDDDVPGYGVRLRTGGSAGYIFQFRFGAKQRRISIGSVTAITESKAREQAVKFYAAVKLGRDPVAEKNESKNLANETVATVLPLFLARQQERLRPRAYVEVERHLMVHTKRLHGLSLAKVSRRDVASVLTLVASKKSGATVNRVRSSLSGFFVWAIRQGLIDVNPVAWTERREEVSRARVLADRELREIWSALKDDAYGDIVKLLLLTAARREEIGGLRWSELDLDRALITLPSERTKNKRPHDIPLSADAVAILRAQRPLTWPDGSACDFVFARGRRGFSDWRGSKVDLDRRLAMAKLAHWVLHDFRRMFSTVAHDVLGIAPHIVEACLGHAGGHRAGVAGVYNKATYAKERAIALARWADYVIAAVEGRDARVVSLRAS